MNRLISDPIEFEKTIAKLSFYTEEEKQVLTSICMSINTTHTNYNSINNVKLQNNINIIESQIPKIYNKRINYIEVLRKILANYEQYTKQIKSTINNITDDVVDIVNTMNKEV